jgi:hypothetical protein
MAFDYARALQKDRKDADYGFGVEPEPYDAATIDIRLSRANHLIEDLKTLL